VRGKASAPTEFGSKLSAGLVDGSAFLDRLDWDPYNESGDLVAQVEAFRRRFGHYPESVHCDKIYRSRDNRKFCKKHGIRMSGSPLGRPVEETTDNAAELHEKACLRHQDELDRIPIEGKFGQGRRCFGLARIMARLSRTCETVIAVTFIVMNLEKWLKQVLLSLFASHGAEGERSLALKSALEPVCQVLAGLGRVCSPKAGRFIKERGSLLLSA